MTKSECTFNGFFVGWPRGFLLAVQPRQPCQPWQAAALAVAGSRASRGRLRAGQVACFVVTLFLHFFLTERRCFKYILKMSEQESEISNFEARSSSARPSSPKKEVILKDENGELILLIGFSQLIFTSRKWCYFNSTFATLD